MVKKMLIFFDLDDTLLKKDKSVSSNTLKVLKLLQDKGHKIIIDTARNKIRTLPLIDIIKPDYTIINAGSYIVDNKMNVIRSLLIDKEKSKKLINEVIDKVDTISIQTDDYLYTNDVSDKNMNLTYYDFNDFQGMDCYKVLVNNLDLSLGHEIAKKYQLDFENYFGGSWSRFCDINATKAKALEFIASFEGVSLDKTIAFGDDYGDIAMIRTSFVGVAVSNALDDVKRNAKFICGSSEDDGVARFLDDYFNLNVYNGGN